VTVAGQLWEAKGYSGRIVASLPLPHYGRVARDTGASVVTERTTFKICISQSWYQGESGAMLGTESLGAGNYPVTLKDVSCRKR
jgi:hypothetical protein